MNAVTDSYVPGTDNEISFGAMYKIKSVGHGTVLDDWGGKVGANTAALEADDQLYNRNRTWMLRKNANGFRIQSVGHGTVLDDWDGKVGADAAALQPDDDPDKLNRTWKLIKNAHGFRIKSVGHGTVLDDWGGKTGADSAGMQPDDAPEKLNRTWIFVPQIKDAVVLISSFDFGNALQELLQSGGTLDYALSETTTVESDRLNVRLTFKHEKTYTNKFSWGMNQKFGFSHTTKISCGLSFEGISSGAEESLTVYGEFGSSQAWETTKSATISSEVSFAPEKPGVYRVGRLVKQFDNQNLPYKARLTLSGKAPFSDELYPGDVLATFLKMEGYNVVEVGAETATAEIEGNLLASFAVSSTTICQRIGDVAPHSS